MKYSRSKGLAESARRQLSDDSPAKKMHRGGVLGEHPEKRRKARETVDAGVGTIGG